jgi:hypothetical protein
MDQKIYHGKIFPQDFSSALFAHFHHGNLRVQQIGEGEKIILQIASTNNPASGGQTAIGVSLQKVEDGVIVQLGKQTWGSVAASLGVSALSAFRNPLSLLHRIDDIAQDIENLQIRDRIWDIIEITANNLGAGIEFSERLRKYICQYCDAPNPPGEPHCIACGAPLGDIQPIICKNCGYILFKDEKHCPNCTKPSQR